MKTLKNDTIYKYTNNKESQYVTIKYYDVLNKYYFCINSKGHNLITKESLLHELNNVERLLYV